MMHMPSVSVMMAVRQEGDGLRAVLEAVISQDYPALEKVAIAVGPSSDETPDVVHDIAARDNRVLPVANHAGIVSAGLNTALTYISSDYVVRVDGHCVVPPDYISRLVATSLTTGASCVGPRLNTIGRTPKQKAIAAAMSSTLGVGASRFRTSRRSGFVDTVPFGLYRRDIFRRIGDFHEELVRNQDDEFNARLRRHGGTIYLDADVVVSYLPRDCFRALWRQYFSYGYYRVVSALHMDHKFGLRQLAPAALTAALTVSAASGHARSATHASVVPWAYGAFLGVAGLNVLFTTGSPSVALLAIPAVAVLHLGYGSGTWWSLFVEAESVCRRCR